MITEDAEEAAAADGSVTLAETALATATSTSGTEEDGNAKTSGIEGTTSTGTTEAGRESANGATPVMRETDSVADAHHLAGVDLRLLCETSATATHPWPSTLTALEEALVTVARRQQARQTRTHPLVSEADSAAVVVADGNEDEDEAAVVQAEEATTTIAIASRRALGLKRADGAGMTATAAVTALTEARDGLNGTRDPTLMIVNRRGSSSGPRWSEPPPPRHPRLSTPRTSHHHLLRHLPLPLALFRPETQVPAMPLLVPPPSLRLQAPEPSTRIDQPRQDTSVKESLKDPKRHRLTATLLSH